MIVLLPHYVAAHLSTTVDKQNLFHNRIYLKDNLHEGIKESPYSGKWNSFNNTPDTFLKESELLHTSRKEQLRKMNRNSKRIGKSKTCTLDYYIK